MISKYQPLNLYWKTKQSPICFYIHFVVKLFSKQLIIKVIKHSKPEAQNILRILHFSTRLINNQLSLQNIHVLKNLKISKNSQMFFYLYSREMQKLWEKTAFSKILNSQSRMSYQFNLVMLLVYLCSFINNGLHL